MKLIRKCQDDINDIIEKNKNNLNIPTIDFKEDSRDFNDDLKVVFDVLDSLKMNPRWLLTASYVEGLLCQYIENTMLPQLMTLQIFVVIGAFVVEEKPIVDIFYTFKDNQRTKRTPMEFCIIMCGDFMTFFYKV